MLHAFFRTCLAILTVLPLALPLQAQEASADAGALAAAIEQAAENGVGVIVLDGSGRLVNGASMAADEAAPEDDPMEGASMLMRGQSRVGEFREELNSRLGALPYSIFEVQHVLRETSPDGRIQTYLEVRAFTVCC